MKCDRDEGDFTSCKVHFYDTNGTTRSTSLKWRAGSWSRQNKDISGDGLDVSAIDRIEWVFVAADATAFYKKIDIVYAHGGLKQDVDGQIDGADQFDGVLDYVTVDHSESLNISNAITLAVWVRLDALGSSYKGIIMKHRLGTPDDCYGLYWNDEEDSYCFTLRDLATLEVSVNGAAADTWYYLVSTYDATTAMKGYVDGALISSNVVNGSFNASSKNVTLGRRDGGPYYFNGYMDEPRISRTARSAEWIETTYNNQSNAGTFLSSGAEIPRPRRGMIVVIR